MSEFKDVLVRKLGQPCASAPVPTNRHAEYQGVLPGLLLELWEEFGFAGFHEGRLWLCDPREWDVAATAWTANLDLVMGRDRWHCVARDAFGSMYLWGERTGMSLSVEPIHGMVFPAAASANLMDSERNRDAQVLVKIGSARERSDLLGSDGKPLFERALKAHGPVGPSTMYTFVPAYALGGPLDTKHIEIADAVTHVELLAQLSPHRTMGDITMS